MKKEMEIKVLKWFGIGITFFIMIVFIVFQNDKNNVIQVSEFKYENRYLIGEIKNTKNKDYNVKITFKLTSGNLTKDIDCETEVKAFEMKKIKCLSYGIDEKYKIKIDNIKVTKI